MSEISTLGKIKILRRMLQRASKQADLLPSLDKTLKESESFVKLRIKDIETDMEQAVCLDHEIVGDVEGDCDQVDAFIEEDVLDQIKTKFTYQLMHYHEMLNMFSTPPETNIVSGNNSQQNTTSNPLLNSTIFKQTMLNIEPFDGNYEKWADFKDSFECNIHNNSDLCNSTKLRYLQSVLKGDALRVIKRGPCNLKPENYESTWALLTRRYEHKRSLVNSYFEVLFNQEVIVKETAEELRNLHDTTYDTLSCLANLDLKTDQWGDILVFLVRSKLPIHTLELWEEKLGSSDELSDFKSFMEFLETRFRTLQGIEKTRQANKAIKVNRLLPTKKMTLKTETKNEKTNKNESTAKCKCCEKGAHYLRSCDKFRKMDTQSRINFVRGHEICYNCLAPHHISVCKSSSNCLVCQKRHNTMLHLDQKQTISNNQVRNNNFPAEGVPSTSDGRFSKSNTALVTRSTGDVIFPTALINVISDRGITLKLRALIDACSDASYITEKAVQQLQLNKKRQSVETSGLGGCSTSSSQFSVLFRIGSLVNSTYQTKVSAYVLPKISTPRPLSSFEVGTIPQNIEFADPYFNIPAGIDILLGGNIDAMISMSGCINSSKHNIVFKQTKLGWLVSGAVKHNQCFTICAHQSHGTLKSLDNTMRKFWETEEMSTDREQTADEKLTERMYDATTRRLSDGTYSVSLPFNKKVHGFVNMRKIAMSRYLQLERKFSRNDHLYDEYSKCLTDYIDLNHMSEIDHTTYSNAYYLPHHCVMKESSTTTKLRVVFDASAKDSNLRSLNSYLFNGPRLQADLLDTLLQFRTFEYAFTADIQQMYRQIWMNPNDRKFQLLLWRPNKNSEIKTYELNTVTFGTTSAPYLAVKTLARLAEDERDKYPIGAECVLKGFYVDDFIYGANSISEALVIQNETRLLLQSGGFNLRKWSTNHPSIIENIPIEDRETKSLLSFEDKEQSVKTLGIYWSPSDDQFQFKIELIDREYHTKRTALSDIARIFDPLGWISPCTISAKLLIQQLWLKQQEWDEPLPVDINTEWLNLREQVPLLSNVKLPRWLGTNLSRGQTELHGFADASEKAYAAVVYVRTLGPKGSVNLLFCKTKVAPLKKISLPRLELNAAYLLAKLLDHAKKILGIDAKSVSYWSDSMIALSWIKDHPHKRTTYVANRVSEIQSLSNPADWFHVKSKENPADLGTRGILPLDIITCNLWWHGPSFIHTFEKDKFMGIANKTIKQISLPIEENKKQKPEVTKRTKIFETFINSKKSPIMETIANVKSFEGKSTFILNKFSTLSKLCRIVAYCKRVNKKHRSSDLHISPCEYEAALLSILRMVQRETYETEFELLSSGKQIPRNSSIYSLSPFLSEQDSLIRVNSRIKGADHLSFDQKYPIILPYKHHISTLIARHAHMSTLHGTQQQTLFLIGQRYHIIRCKLLIKTVTHNCVTCYRFRCETASQQMGQLPYNRINPSRPFSNCGVDLAGPFELKKWKGRCNQFVKAYFAIFVCFATKAVHLEVVVDLSSVEFIAAYRRFISRRGTPSHIYSDCGTNFVGAESTITRSKREYLEKWNANMAKEMAEFQTVWHFNPPASPHFGGLWEAGVKSAKYHLKRIVGNARLSYDEFETILVQIEACMNSRPLTTIDSNPESIVLTPAHFLIQSAMNALPEMDLEGSKLSTADRWNHLQKLVQQFWKLWSSDYLNTLRQRKKWKTSCTNLKINDVVLIKDANLPPTMWLLGKIEQIYPGEDGLVRVAKVRTKTSILDRPIVKLCPLPIDND